MPDLQPSSGRKGLDELAKMLEVYIDDHLPPEEPFSLVGFSMGGLVCRYYLQRLDGMRRVRRFISLSTPHNGSWVAYLVANRGCRQMRPGSPFLNDLNKDVHTLERVRVVSIWTPLDLSILPAWSSRLPIGTELKLGVVMHRFMIKNKHVLEELSQLLRN